MNSGNRISSISALVVLGACAAADAGRVGEDGTGAMWVAPELLEALGEGVTQPVDLQANGRVTFEWHPATGELSFATDGVSPAIRFPEDFSSELSELVTPSF